MFPHYYYYYCITGQLFKFGQISLSDYGLWRSKIRNGSKNSWREMHANQFCWVWPLRFRWFFSLLSAFKNSQNHFRPWTIVHEGQKLESAQKIHASRGWHELHASQFWRVWPLWFLEILLLFVCLQKQPKFPFGPWTMVHGNQKIELAQKINASRGWCDMHVHWVWWAWPLRFQRF